MISVPESSLVVTVLGAPGARNEFSAKLTSAVPEILVRPLTLADEALARSLSAGSHLVVALAKRQRTSLSVAAHIDAFIEYPGDAERMMRRCADMARRLNDGRLPAEAPPQLEPWSRTWPITARRLSRRVLRAFSHSGARVQHIGSTAIPGLPAPPVIELQLAVPRLIDLDLRAGALAAAGLVDARAQSPDAPGVLVDRPRGEAAGTAEWPKRLLVGVDEEQRFVVHGRAFGSPGWRFALMFRDWLRNDPGARAEYAALSMRLADRPDDPAAADALLRPLDEWLDEAAERAEHWASRSGWVVERSG